MSGNALNNDYVYTANQQKKVNTGRNLNRVKALNFNKSSSFNLCCTQNGFMEEIMTFRKGIQNRRASQSKQVDSNILLIKIISIIKHRIS